MAKKELKKQNPELEINLVDLISNFDPSTTGKFTTFLIKMFKKSLKGNRLDERGVSDPEFDAQTWLSDGIYHMLGGSENIQILNDFNHHLAENRIPTDQKDIGKYESWNEINRTVSIATLKQKEKLLEKEILKVVDTEEWLAIRPLTFASSLVYGGNTKWCTTSKASPHYFYKYCNRGVLVYVISRVSGEKYGLYYENYRSNNKEFSIWNVLDYRIDSVETEIPSDLLKKLFEYMKNEKNNSFYFSEEEKLESNNFYNENEELMVEEMPLPVNVLHGRYDTFIEEATIVTEDEHYTEEVIKDNIPHELDDNGNIPF